LSQPICLSIFSAAGLLDHVKEVYGFSAVFIELFVSSFGDIYRVVTPTAKFILRVYHAKPHTRDSILSEVQLLDHLHQHGLSVAHPIRRSDGDWLLTLDAPEGTRYAVLYSFAEGEQISATTSLDSVVEYGELVGRIHLIADTFPIALNRQPITFESLVDDGLDRLLSLCPQYKDEISYMREVADAIRPQIERLPTTKPLYGLCHGDASASNVFISADGHPTLFDFDSCGPSWRIYDVGSFVSNVAYRNMPAEFSEAFLEGYERIRPLEPSERSAIPLIKILRKYLTISWMTAMIEPFGSHNLSDAFIAETVDQIRTIYSAL
jgi:Ser/Thr protein kinase RdoA (MazF antagonist)